MTAPPDYYQILGVPEDAPLSLIRRSYRLIALRSHPDTNPNDSVAAERFRFATEAYDVLSDEYSRAAYDIRRRGELPAEDSEFLHAPRSPAGFTMAAEEAKAAWDYIQNLESMWETAQRRDQKAQMEWRATREAEPVRQNTRIQLFFAGLCIGVLAMLGGLIGILFFW